MDQKSNEGFRLIINKKNKKKEPERLTDTIKNGAIYCRVSTDEQVKNTSLELQRRQCEEYCKSKEIKVSKVFIEEGESAKTANRTQLRKLKDYLKKNPDVRNIIVFRSDRIARNISDFIKLIEEFEHNGIVFHSVTEHFDNSSAGKFSKNIMACVNEYDNNLRAERCRGGLHARMNKGYYVSRPPIGYSFERVSNIPMLKICPDTADLVRTAFKLMAQGVYSQTELVYRLNAMGLRTKKNVPLTKQSLNSILTNPLYAGGMRNSEGEIIRGMHEPIVNQNDFNKVQLLLGGSIQALIPHARVHPDFPLRKFVVCDRCSNPLTGSWSTSHTKKKFAYYRCYRIECKAINIRKEKIEAEFTTLLQGYSFQKEYMALFKEAITDIYRQNEKDRLTIKAEIERKISKYESRKIEYIKALADKILSRDEYSLAMKENDAKITAGRIELENIRIEMLDINSLLDYALDIINNASRIWGEANINQKEQLQKIFFPEGLRYSLEKGLVGRYTGYIFKISGYFNGTEPPKEEGDSRFQKNSMVHHPGLEPGTR